MIEDVREIKGIKDINNILSIVINDLDKGKDKISNIADSLRLEFEKKKIELVNIQNEIEFVIDEVTRLEKIDKNMRKKLADSSIDFNGKDKDMENIYEKALNVRVEYITMQKEEKSLQNQREVLQRSIKKYLANIEQADSVVGQVSVAMKYLTGEVYDNLENLEGDNKFSLGIKIVEIQEKERNKIAREIHDGPAQYLASTLMRIDFCKARLKDNLQKGLIELDDVKGNITKTLKEVRGIICNLRPPFFDGITLKEAIDDLKDVFLEECDVNLKVRFENESCLIDKTIETAMYRIIQELLNNIKKHSKAHNASLNLEVGMDYIFIKVKDDGIGFNTEEIIDNSRCNNKKYGILGIYERLDELGGTITVESRLDNGTIYMIKLPRIRRRDNFDKISNS
ncbi:sensor histidine kinase [Clostridium vincentii]|uniref:histidine kinase n=1 Tax=Clostridium vincentii TaxID=52704 RepID=A0A2T0BB54_9CLOT|nr:sensor histidine kinase [Clostridium vincentii]PRR81129.1 Signal transduction histidine-protein kinase/phosphatase DegS [Clostridium vincentii]